MADLDRAILIAAQEHQGQTDKAGAPYILHPLRVMLRMRSESDMIVAVLHDVIEDSGWTLDNLEREGFSREIIDAVDRVTRRESETYDAFIERVKANPAAVRVKLADLEDNMDVRRIAGLTEKDMERLQKYHKAWLALTGCQRD